MHILIFYKRQLEAMIVASDLPKSASMEKKNNTNIWKLCAH
jgi:hypothetical protein